MSYSMANEVDDDGMTVYDQYEDYFSSYSDKTYGDEFGMGNGNYGFEAASPTIPTTTTTTARSRVVNYVQNIKGDEEVVPGGLTTIFVLVFVSVLCILVCLMSCVKLCRKRGDASFVADFEADVRHMSAGQVAAAAQALDYEDSDFSAAIQNRHFMSAADKEMSCLNCRLIEMGSMACYQELCPQCGRPPPR